MLAAFFYIDIDAVFMARNAPEQTSAVLHALFHMLHIITRQNAVDHAVPLPHKACCTALYIGVLIHKTFAVFVNKKIKEVLPCIVLRMHHQREHFLCHNAACPETHLMTVTGIASSRHILTCQCTQCIRCISAAHLRITADVTGCKYNTLLYIESNAAGFALCVDTGYFAGIILDQQLACCIEAHLYAFSQRILIQGTSHVIATQRVFRHECM